MEARVLDSGFAPVITVTEAGGVKIDPAVEQDIRALKRAVAASMRLILAMNEQDEAPWRAAIDEARAAIKDLT